MQMCFLICQEMEFTFMTEKYAGKTGSIAPTIDWNMILPEFAVQKHCYMGGGTAVRFWLKG